MKKIVSIALFGEGDKYARYLPAFVRGHLNLFPLGEDWRLRVNVDDAVLHSEHGRYLARLFNAGLVDVASMDAAPLTKAMLWRMAPVFDDGVDFVFCRDLDAPPMPRDRACCEEFIRVALDKKCSVHTIHDNLFHEGIMGGLCGFHAPTFREVTGWGSLEDLYAAGGAVDYAKHGVDQLVLNRLLLKPDGPRLFEHRFAGWHAGPGKHSPRTPGCYQCAGVSSPVPTIGNGSSLRLEACLLLDQPGIMRADLLGNHLGCAGYDIEAAIRFWNVYGDARIAAAVGACEAR